MKDSLDMLTYLVESWADERNLIKGSDPKSQCLKLIEEVGELARSINKKTDVRDDIGDCLDVLTIIAAQKGTTLRECMSIAYDDIKDREGVMLDGVFIKSTDENYEHAIAIINNDR